MCQGCGRQEELGCEAGLPVDHPLRALGWVREYTGHEWNRCPGWYAYQAPPQLRRIVRRAEQLAALAEIGCPATDLTEAGESLVILARRYRDRLEAEERSRQAEAAARDAKRGGR